MTLLTPVLVGSAWAQGIPYPRTKVPGYAPLYVQPRVESPLVSEHPAYFDLKSSLFRDTTIIDFEKRQITFMRFDAATGVPIWVFHYAELEEYLSSSRGYALLGLWDDLFKKVGGEKQEKKRPRLEFALPVHYPAWARRVLGKNPPKLSIKGYQTIDISVQGSKTKVGGDEDDTSPGFQFDYDNMFTIAGSVGRLINIEIKTGKSGDEEFDFQDQLKKFKIEYKGDTKDELEDEIVQEVVAGYTNFPMPGQGLAGYSGGHEGLFGIKVRSQIGPLALTTIASIEKGESQKMTLSPTGGGRSTPTSEKGFARNAFFFLDMRYREKYQNPNAPDVPPVSVLKVYVAREGEQADDVIQNYAYAHFAGEDSLAGSVLLRKMRENDDYYLNRAEGWIRFNKKNRPGDRDRIAICLVTADPSYNKGDSTVITKKNGIPVLGGLWVLKDRHGEAMVEADSTFLLMWRNVYEIRGDVRADDFEISIVRDFGAGDTASKRETPAPRKYFANLLGIADENARPLTSNTEIFDFDNGYLIFPDLEPFGNSDLLGSNNSVGNATPVIYEVELNKTEFTEAPAHFSIYMSGTSRQSCFNLGFGLMPNTEKVTINNGTTTLLKGTDYIIDYEFGSLELISERAKAADHIDIEYQQSSLFMFDRKNFLGVHGRLDMPNIGRDSYIATSLMLQTTSVDESRIPRIGSEPFRRFFFDANTQFDFEPEWMTKAVNLLPLVSTNRESEATFSFETAYSNVSPEAGKEAYIDDFLSSKREYPLGEASSLWYRAGVPRDWLGVSASGHDKMLWRPPAWQFYWYTPEDNARTRKTMIWAPRPYVDEEPYLATMKLECRPVPDNPELLNQVTTRSGLMSDSVVVNPWAGIMTAIPVSLKVGERNKYLEFWMKNQGGGVLYIDMGEVSEDLSLNGGPPSNRMDREKETIRYREYNEKYDLGLDSLRNEDEFYLYPDLVDMEWDTLKYEDPLLGAYGTDPSRDDYREYTNSVRDKSNGTESDQYLTNEDINNNGFSTRENFFRVKIDFDNLDTCSFVDTSMQAADPNSGWRHFRVRVNSPDDEDRFDRFGNPDWENISFVRLLWTDFPDNSKKQVDTLEFTEMRFVGNQWEERAAVDSGDVKVEASVLNTIDHKRPAYWHPPDKTMEKEEGNKKVDKKDQSLVIEYRGLRPGDEALVERNLTTSYQSFDLSGYKSILMAVRDVDLSIYNDDHMWFVFRFGRDDSTFYEYRPAVVNDSSTWSWENGLVIELRRFAQLKLDYFDHHGDEPEGIDTAVTDLRGNRYRILSRTRLVPSFADIKWMALGVVCDSTAFPSDSGSSGVLWINGLRVCGLEAMDGWAFRASIGTHWADFMDLSATLNYDDADFRQMSEDYQTNKGARLSGGMTGQWFLDKFVPREWDVSVPFGASVSASLSRPKLRPRSDIPLTHEDGTPDRLGEMGRDFADMVLGTRLSNSLTQAEHYQTASMNRSWNTSFSKGEKSDNPFTRFTAERTSVSYSYSHDTSTTLEGGRPEGGDHVDIRSTKGHRSSLKYDLSPRRPAPWTSWSPFSDTKAKWVPRDIKALRLNMLPSRVHFTVADGDYRWTYNARSRTGDTSWTEGLGITHGFQFGYAPIDPLIETDFNLTLRRDFHDALLSWRDVPTRNARVSRFLNREVLKWDSEWKKYYVTAGELSNGGSRSQDFSLNFDPRIFNWLTHSADYSADYSQCPQTKGGDQRKYLKTGVKSSFGFTSEFRTLSFLETLRDWTQKATGLSKAFGVMANGLDKIELRSFSFRYKASSNLQNNYINTGFLDTSEVWAKDFFAYQLGFKDRDLRDIVTGNMSDRRAFGGMRYRGSSGDWYSMDNRSTGQDISVGTGLTIPRPLDISMQPISLGWDRRYSVKPDTNHVDTTTVFPKIGVKARSSMLEKIAVVKQNMQNLGLNSSYEYTRSISRKTRDTKDQTKKHEWRPLVGVHGQIKKVPINLDYQFSTSSEATINMRDTVPTITVFHEQTSEKSRDRGHTWNVRYKIPGKSDREINVFNKWSIPIKGDINTKIEANYNRKFTQRFPDEENKGELVDWDFRVHPEIRYDFTHNVDGVMQYTGEKSYVDESDETRTNHVFSLVVTIRFN